MRSEIEWIPFKILSFKIHHFEPFAKCGTSHYYISEGELPPCRNETEEGAPPRSVYVLVTDGILVGLGYLIFGGLGDPFFAIKPKWMCFPTEIQPTHWALMPNGPKIEKSHE